MGGGVEVLLEATGVELGLGFDFVDALRMSMSQTDPREAEWDLQWWYGWVSRSGIPEMKKVPSSRF